MKILLQVESGSEIDLDSNKELRIKPERIWNKISLSRRIINFPFLYCGC